MENSLFRPLRPGSGSITSAAVHILAPGTSLEYSYIKYFINQMRGLFIRREMQLICLLL